jgi:ribosomal protein S18 acetylase RimI-like enzyme
VAVPPALYAAVRERPRDDEDHEARDPDAGGRVLATARLALVDGWGGLYAVATRPEARRRGLSRAAVDAVVHVGIDRGVTALWLQVLADNDAARALYASLGFAPASRYEYWARPGDR